MLRTVFMGTPHFAAVILEKLVAGGVRPVAVVCQPPRQTGRGLRQEPCETQRVAERLELPVYPFEDVNTDSSVAELRALRPDLFLVAAFGQILKKRTLGIPTLFSLNVHGSLLPKYRGAAPIQRALLAGEATTGITIQKMALKMDAGDILLQKKTPINPSENAAQLFERLAVIGAEALLESVHLVEKKQYHLTPQDESQATYAPKVCKEEALVDWRLPAPRLLCQIRALQPWPIAETRLGGQRLKIFDAQLADAPPGEPGTVLTDHQTQLVVVCGEGALSLTQIQLENRKKMETRPFLMAYRGNFPFSKVG